MYLHARRYIVAPIYIHMDTWKYRVNSRHERGCGRARVHANVNGDGSLGRPTTFSDPVPFCRIRRFNRQARSKDCEVMGRGEEAS